MTAQSHFLKLNDVVLKVICGNLDFNSILTLRKVSHGIRKFVDFYKPESHLDKIKLTMCAEKVILCLKAGEQFISIDYQKEENGCSVVCGKTKKSIDEDYLNAFLNDLQIILNHQKTVLKYFSINCLNEMKNRDQFFSDFYPKFHNILKGRNQQLQVKEIKLPTIRQEQIIPILNFIEPKTLYKLELVDWSVPRRQYEIDGIVHLEQWKQAKELDINDLELADFGLVHSFKHFLEADIALNSVTSNDLFILKEAFLHLPNFKYFSINYEKFDDKDHLLELFGQPIEDEAYGIEGRIWTFPVPDSERTVSVIDVTSGNIFFTLEPPPIGIFDEYIFEKYSLDEEAYEMELDSDFGSDSDVDSDSDLDMDADMRLDSDVNSGSDVELN